VAAIGTAHLNSDLHFFSLMASTGLASSNLRGGGGVVRLELSLSARLPVPPGWRMSAGGMPVSPVP
jgi:hypothetical protein